MAAVTQRGARWQIRIKHKLLPKPFFYTFEDEAAARSYAHQMEAALAAGIVPFELLDAKPKPKDADDPLVIKIMRDYSKAVNVAPSDEANLKLLLTPTTGLRFSHITYQWARQFVVDLKLKDNLAPGTIRKRVESLARVLDWHLLQVAEATKGNGIAMPMANPLRLLPRGYSLYSSNDANALAGQEGKKVKTDVKRNFRLPVEQEKLVLAALDGLREAEGKKPLPSDPELKDLYTLLVNTGMRLSECFKLRVGQIDFTEEVINVEGSKGHRGVIKLRFVPMVPALVSMLRAKTQDKPSKSLVFPFWSGTPEDIGPCSSSLSKKFRKIFDHVGLNHLREHDLRHEATCRFVTYRTATGVPMFTETEVCKIMGWNSSALMLRYASLRGRDLSGLFNAT
ncbi:MAG: site-specific integrase [Betaproteobacteria bacterium]|nr:site-specific integrase [Betaproteobacteria bacterium]